MSLPLYLDPATLRWVSDEATREARRLEELANNFATDAIKARERSAPEREVANLVDIVKSARNRAGHLRLQARGWRGMATRIETKRRKAARTA